MAQEINTSDGYICLFRKFLNWEWYDDANTMRLFLHCLLSANHKDNNWRGITIQKGSFISSVGNLANSLGLTVQQIRTSLNKLKSTNEITIKTTSHYSIIAINNWELYQTNNKQNNKRVTNKQQTNNKQITTNNNDNNENNEKNEKNIISKKTYGEFSNIKLTENEYKKLKDIYSFNLDKAIQILSNYLESKGDKYKSHYAVLNKGNWVYKRVMEEKQEEKNNNHFELPPTEELIRRMEERRNKQWT